MPIGQITQITDIQSQKVTDEHKNKDIKYKEKLTFKILNGEIQGANNDDSPPICEISS